MASENGHLGGPRYPARSRAPPERLGNPIVYGLGLGDQHEDEFVDRPQLQKTRFEEFAVLVPEELDDTRRKRCRYLNRSIQNACKRLDRTIACADRNLTATGSKSVLKVCVDNIDDSYDSIRKFADELSLLLEDFDETSQAVFDLIDAADDSVTSAQDSIRSALDHDESQGIYGVDARRRTSSTPRPEAADIPGAGARGSGVPDYVRDDGNAPECQDDLGQRVPGYGRDDGNAPECQEDLGQRATNNHVGPNPRTVTPRPDPPTANQGSSQLGQLQQLLQTYEHAIEQLQHREQQRNPPDETENRQEHYRRQPSHEQAGSSRTRDNDPDMDRLRRIVNESRTQSQGATNNAVTTPNQQNRQPQLPVDDDVWSFSSESGSLNRSDEALVSVLERLAARAELPALPTMKFDGSPAEITRFLHNFSERVDSKTSLSDSHKLSQLFEVTTGKAREAVEPYLGQANGYQDAMRKLKKRFGQPLQIVDAIIARLDTFQTIRSNDSDTLVKFSDRLSADFRHLHELGLLSEADTQGNIKRVFTKLPSRIQAKWVEQVNNLEARDLSPTFGDIVVFVASQAKKSSHPIYQVSNNRYKEKPEPKPKQQNDNNATILSADWTPRQGPPKSPRGRPGGSKQYTDNERSQDVFCIYCKRRDNHDITICPSYVSLNVQERKDFAFRHGLCFICLGKHSRKFCKLKIFCGIGSCDKPHHKLLHFGSKRPEWNPPSKDKRGPDDTTGNLDLADTDTDTDTDTPPAAPTDSKADKSEEESELDGELSGSLRPRLQTKVLLRVVPVTVTARDHSLTTYALIDGGSTCTIVTRQLADRLNVKGKKSSMTMNTVVRSNSNLDVEYVNLEVSSARSDKHKFPIIDAHVLDTFTVEDKFIQSDMDFSQHDHLAGLRPLDINVDIDTISILIGQDVPQAHEVLEYRYGNNPTEQPYGIRSVFGWHFAGPTGAYNRSSKESIGTPSKEAKKTSPSYKTHHVPAGDEEVATASVEDIQRLNEAVTKLWDEDKHGFVDNGTKAPSEEDKRALCLMEEYTVLGTDGHYIVPLLWKHPDPQLPDNSVVANHSLRRLAKKFRNNPAFANMYRTTMESYFTKGYARSLSSVETQTRTSKTWYLPHQGEQNPNKPHKVRVVFNAASTYKGRTLNKELLHGPDLNNSMLGVLLRFRQSPVAIGADISEMFHQVKTSPEDAEAFRFVYWEGGDPDKSAIHCQMTRHIFGATDSPSACVYALQRCAKDNASEFDAGTSRTILKNFYVDDLMKSTTTVDEATRLALQLREMLARGGFQLVKFISNRIEVVKSLPKDCVLPALQDVPNLGDLTVQRALGVLWNVYTDTLSVKVDIVARPNTRAGVLSFICSIPDPFGLICPTTLVGRRILQEACRRKLRWDDDLEEAAPDLMKSWRKFMLTLPSLKNFEVTRCYRGLEEPEKVKKIELHTFCDASEFGYGSASYLRVEKTDGTIHVSLVQAKSRTAPLKQVTIPKLEMQAAAVSARVSESLLRELELQPDRVFYWTDSMIALQYIYSETRRFKMYVSNRREDILSCSTREQWRHCPTDYNPADLASRGVPGNKLITNLIWTDGPGFLREQPDRWPQAEVKTLADDDPEIKKEKAVLHARDDDPHATLDDFIDRCSDWISLRRGAAWMMRYIQFLTCPKEERKKKIGRKLVASDLNCATAAIIRYIQKSTFPEELKRLSKIDERLPVSVHSPMRNLRPVLIDGIIRVGGRLAEAPLSFQAKHPMILPKTHHLTTLLIRHYHAILAHSGPEHVLAEIRNNYWIIGGRASIKSVTSNCIICKRMYARPMSQVMPPLPAQRVTPLQQPFLVTGCDCFGPLHVKRGRTTQKMYAILFTCLSTRAVHLELIQRMSTDSFLCAFEMFINRRCYPTDIYCDNGSNFVGGAKEFKKASKELDTNAIEKSMVRRGINFHFMTPTASSHCGVWERLVKTVKLALKATLSTNLVSEEVLRSVLTGVERIVNSRPITPSSDDIDDLEALTPNHMLLHHRVDCTPVSIVDDSDIYRKSWRQIQYLQDLYWKRWTSYYLPLLQKLTKWQRETRDCKIGDLVLVAEDGLRRGAWPLGRITATHPGNDGHVRTVTVRTSSGTYKRPIQKLCLLEAV